MNERIHPLGETGWSGMVSTYCLMALCSYVFLGWLPVSVFPACIKRKSSAAHQGKRQDDERIKQRQLRIAAGKQVLKKQIAGCRDLPQRGYGAKPRVGAKRLPWEHGSIDVSTPTGLRHTAVSQTT